MNQPAANLKISVEDYLAGEKDGEVRHEYIDGEVYAMTGASRRHGLLSTNLALLLGSKAKNEGCQLFVNDMKVYVHQSGVDAFYYPDLVLTCDPDDRADYYCERPCLIIEVLSETTERIDRREKLFAYTAGLSSLQEYLLVAQDHQHVEIHRRTENDWAHEVYETGAIHLDCLDMDLSLDAIYEDVMSTMSQYRSLTPSRE